MVSDCRNDVSTVIIKNCFCHVRFQTAVNDETQKVTIRDDNLDPECFPKQYLQYFVEVDAALWTSEEPSGEQIVKSILNANEDESEKADD